MFFFIFFIFETLANNQFIPHGIVISTKYRDGRFLIYDCVDKHYVCADEFAYDKCKYWRNRDLKNNNLNLICAPLKVFEKELDCFQSQQKLINQLVPAKFCFSNYNQ